MADIIVSVTGNSSTPALGTVTAVGVINIRPTSLSSTMILGSVAVNIPVVVTVTGLSITMELGQANKALWEEVSNVTHVWTPVNTS